MSAIKRIGHKGADLIAPGNTVASFDAALEAGVDAIEFDVLSENRDGTGKLVLAHDYTHAEGAITLEQGLDHFCHERYATTHLIVDLKLAGYEDRVLSALRNRGLVDRCLISTMDPASLRRLRALDATARLGLSVPRVRRDPFARRHTRLVAPLAIVLLRRTLPRRMARAVRAGEIDAAMAHRLVVTPRFVRAMRRAGGELYVWTVDDAAQIAAFVAMGVDGVITNDPRLFAATA